MKLVFPWNGQALSAGGISWLNTIAHTSKNSWIWENWLVFQDTLWWDLLFGILKRTKFHSGLIKYLAEITSCLKLMTPLPAVVLKLENKSLLSWSILVAPACSSVFNCVLHVLANLITLKVFEWNISFMKIKRWCGASQCESKPLKCYTLRGFFVQWHRYLRRLLVNNT